MSVDREDAKDGGPTSGLGLRDADQYDALVIFRNMQHELATLSQHISSLLSSQSLPDRNRAVVLTLLSRPIDLNRFQPDDIRTQRAFQNTVRDLSHNSDVDMLQVVIGERDRLLEQLKRMEEDLALDEEIFNEKQLAIDSLHSEVSSLHARVRALKKLGGRFHGSYELLPEPIDDDVITSPRRSPFAADTNGSGSPPRLVDHVNKSTYHTDGDHNQLLNARTDAEDGDGMNAHMNLDQVEQLVAEFRVHRDDAERLRAEIEEAEQMSAEKDDLESEQRDLLSKSLQSSREHESLATRITGLSKSFTLKRAELQQLKAAGGKPIPDLKLRELQLQAEMEELQQEKHQLELSQEDEVQLRSLDQERQREVTFRLEAIRSQLAFKQHKVQMMRGYLRSAYDVDASEQPSLAALIERVTQLYRPRTEMETYKLISTYVYSLIDQKKGDEEHQQQLNAKEAELQVLRAELQATKEELKATQKREFEIDRELELAADAAMRQSSQAEQIRYLDNQLQKERYKTSELLDMNHELASKLKLVQGHIEKKKAKQQQQRHLLT